MVRLGAYGSSPTAKYCNVLGIQLLGNPVNLRACVKARFLVCATAARAATHSGRQFAGPAHLARPRGSSRNSALRDCPRPAADQALHRAAARGTRRNFRLRHLLPPLEMSAASAALVFIRGHRKLLSLIPLYESSACARAPTLTASLLFTYAPDVLEWIVQTSGVAPLGSGAAHPGEKP